MKALIIEDHDVSADLVKRQLDAIGFNEIYFEEDVQSGLAAIEQNRPDLVVVDERLPDASGIDLIREARYQDGDLIIIMCTVVDDHDTIDAAFEAGCNYYTIKPNGLRNLCTEKTTAEQLINQSNQKVYR